MQALCYTRGMIKAIVFDCFGVLTGSSFRDVYRESGGDLIKDSAFIEEVKGLANAGLISSRELAERCAEQLGIPVKTFTHNLMCLECPNEPLFDYIESQLRPHYKLGMLSNAEKGGPQRHLTKEQLALFDTIAVSGEIGYIKPDPQAFEIVADRLDVQFNEIVFIDDLMRNVEPAKAMGMTSFQYTDLEDLKRQLATVLHVSK